MKRAKIILGAIALFAIVGGALAAKTSKKFNTHTIYTTNALNAAAINVKPNATITASGGAFTFATTKLGDPAVRTLTVAAD